ncbi:hypothetical protein [Jannaschia pohangensis]|uniref:Pentapeptide repeat-containing protein n=1 Tax=Jannaschia pohangensis TaxID=390807 RepID=A0A1I3QFW7_9RHOB|nr:hypothetical protein [Jannaschia pohangensis]SFJ32211.1 hypothetical protein SAMN04488095_2507 [Jannaschia pohangensis]
MWKAQSGIWGDGGVAIIRTWADIAALGGDSWLTPAETALIEACRRGVECRLQGGKRPDPDDAGPERRIRANVLRYLILGGCPDCVVRGRGLQLRGAFIEGEIDLSFQETSGATVMIDCHFDAPLVARQAKLRSLELRRSLLDRLDLQGAHITGDVFLRQAETRRDVLMAGARIGGQLDCEGAIFDGAQGAALMAQRLTVEEGLVWRDVRVRRGTVSLHSARIGVLADDLASWPGRDDLILDGLIYEQIVGDMDLAGRLAWAEAGSYVDDRFHPQPFSALSRLYREMGRDGDARRVLRMRERHLRQDNRRRRLRGPDGAPLTGMARAGALVGNLWRSACDGVLRATTGYGYAPFRSLIVLALLWLLTTTLAHLAWEAGDFAPNAAPILVSNDWQTLASGPQPAAVWSSTAPGRDWETFNRYAWAADLVIPIIDLNQTDAWAVSTSRGPWGRWLWRAGFFLNIAGWIVTALGAAAITGIIRRDG